MELNELHILYCSLRTVNHSDTVASRNQRIGGCLVNSADSARCHQCYFRKESIDFPCAHVHDVSTITFNVGSVASNGYAQMVLGQYFNGEMILEYRNVGMALYCLYQAVLDFCARIIFMMQDTKLGMSAFPVKVEVAICVFVEINTPTD